MARLSPRCALLLIAALGCRTSTPAPADARPRAEAAQTAVELRIEGNSALSRDEILDAAREELDRLAAGGGKAALDDAAWLVAERYRAQGYPDVRVDYRLEDTADGGRRAVLSVHEGPRVSIEEVRFPGAKAFPAGELAAFVLAPPSRLGRRGVTWLVASQLASARGAIESHYLAAGYADVAVGEAKVDRSPDGKSCRVTIPIHEGPRYVLARVELNGLERHPELAAAARAALEARIGKPFTSRLGYEVRAAVRETLGRLGHPDAVVRAQVAQRPPDGRLVLELEVEPGPEVEIGRILVRGATRTREEFVRGRLLLREGERFDRTKLRESFDSLFRTGLFRRVDIRLAEGDGAVRDLFVEVEELPAIELFVEPGLGSYEGPRLQAGIRHANLFGTGRRLSLETKLALRARRVELAWSDPWLFGRRHVLDAELFAGEREEPSFLRRDVGGELRLTRRIGPHLSATIGQEFRRSSAEDVEVDAASLDPADTETVLVSVLSFSPIWDSRDDLFWPQGGALARWKLEWSDTALGSELGYLRSVVALAGYRRLAERTTLAASLRAGVVAPTDGAGSLPLTERFFNGGESTVRSFRESRLGPRAANGEPLGGEVFHLFSAELRRRVAQRWQLALFVDAGNVLPDAQDALSLADTGLGVGVGVRWLLPIGPLRLDLAVNPDPEGGDDRFVVHLAVGAPY